MNITIFGGGSYGIALAKILAESNNDILIYFKDELANAKLKEGYHDFCPEKLSPKIKGTLSLKEACDFSTLYLLVVPTSVMRDVLNEIKELIDKPVLFVNASKGIEDKTYFRVSQIVYDVIDHNKIIDFVCLSGPSHAEELVKNMLTSFVASSNNQENAIMIQELFNNNDYLRVYRNDDLIGTELGGSLKNIFALASGILDGIGYGDNAKATLMTRALLEMIRIAEVMGAKKETLLGLTGLGDLIVTCTSQNSRNYQAGYKIGSGENYLEAISSMTMVVEGAKSCIAAYNLSKEYGLDTPIIDATYQVIYEKVDPKIAIGNLMNRSLKSEKLRL